MSVVLLMGVGELAYVVVDEVRLLNDMEKL